MDAFARRDAAIPRSDHHPPLRRSPSHSADMVDRNARRERIDDGAGDASIQLRHGLDTHLGLWRRFLSRTDGRGSERYARLVRGTKPAWRAPARDRPAVARP